ncbi:SapC family protein [Roseibium salinum]|nr:SapC family protein [Roseibium salinum]
MKAGATYEFAKEVNSVPLTAIEFAQAAAEYPIVFAGNEDAVMPVVVLGAQQTEKPFFVGEKWRVAREIRSCLRSSLSIRIFNRQIRQDLHSAHR